MEKQPQKVFKVVKNYELREKIGEGG